MTKSGLNGTLFVVLGNQLFPPAALRRNHDGPVFMAEDVGLCTYVRHHKQKITLFLAAMREYRDELRDRGYTVHYEELHTGAREQTPPTYEARLARVVRQHDIAHLVLWEIEDRFFEQRVRHFAENNRLQLTFLPSPMFLTSRGEFADWLADSRPHMATFYRWQRRRLGVLLDNDGGPAGGRWSFDHDNRLSLPADESVPGARPAGATQHVKDVVPLVEQLFAGHPGQLSIEDWWLPTTRRQALAWLRHFLDERFARFGPYEDALSTRDPFLFHSVLSPVLNLGLLTPAEVLERALGHAGEHDVPLNSLEGFVRQIIGWREFIRGVYQHFGQQQEEANFFDHRRQLTEHWYRGTTGLRPLDDVIRKALRFGWAHHIERLMIAGNLMTLCEIEPRAAYRWFMELFVDSSDWVMVPNVFGMGLFADGGVFSTKPYICGSNYIRRMGDYPAAGSAGGADEAFSWCDVLDGLYWRFVDRNRRFFQEQARMAQVVGTLDRMNNDRRETIIAAAEAFLAARTRG